MEIKPNYFSNLAVTQKVTRKNGMSYTVRDNRSRFFFPDEWMAFYDALKDSEKVTFNFLINTGARINEVRGVKVSDIDIERNVIILRQTKSRNSDGSRRIRAIPISSEFKRYLNKVIKDYNLTPDSTFPILSTPAAHICMKRTLQRIAIADWFMFSVHNVRKTLETWLFALDIDSMKIVKHFGHSYRVAEKFYVSSDTFTFDDKQKMRMVIGDLYQR